MRCWGYNNYGQLGLGNTATTPIPPLNNILRNVSQISAGQMFTCVVMQFTNGVRCWGDNSVGQLGDNTTNTRFTPPSFDVITGVLQISAGGNHVCVVMVLNNGVRCWGSNNQGQIGDGTPFNRLVPDSVDLISSIAMVSCGQGHTCVLSLQGGVKCWGSNDYGELGDGTTTSRVRPPLNDFMTGVVQVACGLSHTCAVTTNTGVKCWGKNDYGQVGAGTVSRGRNVTVVPGVINVRKLILTPSTDETCVIIQSNTTNGGLLCWGANINGQVGLGNKLPQNSPPANLTIVNVTFASTGEASACAVSNGAVRCWGDNSFGQLGVSTSLVNQYLLPPALPIVIVP